MEITIPHNFDPSIRPYQLTVLSNQSRFKFLQIHRKAGKTALSLNHLVQQSVLTKGVYWYVAPTYRQAKEIIWRDPEMLAKYVPRELISKKNESDLSIETETGAIIVLKGADNPDSLRGPNPKGVILDECFLMKGDVWSEIIAPIAFANPDMWVWFIGTPKPMGAFWEKLYQDAYRRMTSGDTSWFAMKLDAETSQILAPESLIEAKNTMTEQAFRQEFMCEYFGDEGVVFRGIDRCIDDQIVPNQRWDGYQRFQFGTDLAMHVDWTVNCGINLANYEVQVFDRYNQIDYNLQKARIEAMLRSYGNPRCNMDETGVGEPIVQDLRSRGLLINGVRFTAEMKSNLVTNLALWIEQGRIRLPRIPELIEELRMYGYEVTPKGRVTYSAPAGQHDDCVMALALAVWELSSSVGERVGGTPISSLLNKANHKPVKTFQYD